MNDEEYCDSFPYDVHFCVSRGKCAYTFEEVKAEGEGFVVSISMEKYDKTGSATFTAAQIAALQKHFEEEESPSELEGNCFCTRESEPEYALQELKFLADKGKSRTAPTPEVVTERICQALATLSEPDFAQDMTTGDQWRYFVTLFDLQVFENDPVSKAWIEHVSKRVKEISEDKVSVSPVALGDFPEDRGVNSIRDIRIKATDGTSSLYIEILPASNGWYLVKK